MEFSINLDLGSFTTSQPRGLYNFISDIRHAKSKEEERARVDKELANIRQKFAAVANLTSRDKKKYVWKMCYMYMLGYEIDFGHLEFISLISSSKFQEKSVGYMAFSLMFRPGDELMTLVVNSMRNDIIGQLHHGKTLALAAVSNVGGEDLAEALAGDVQRLIVSGLDEGPSYNTGLSAEEEYRHKSLLCKKASLCLLRLFRTNPDCVVLEDWMKRMARLLEDRDLGVVISLMSLLLGFAANTPSMFEPLVPYVISILTRLVTNRTCPPDYLYYKTPCPWLQVKCLRFLQYYKIPSDKTQLDLLCDILSTILVKTEVSDSNNKSNADHSILFEAINLVISFGVDCPSFLREHAAGLLGRFIAVTDANIRYLGLDAMTRLAKVDGPEAVRSHQSTVLESLKDQDISVRKRALNLLYVMTDSSNAREIVSDLLLNLVEADAAMKEDMVVKIAILAEKFCGGSDWEWYVSTMLQATSAAGDFVAEGVWYRLVQVVINNPDIHDYAAERLMVAVEGKYTHETVVAVAAYLLGEIGVNICEQAGMSGLDQFNVLHQHFTRCSLKVQGILLTTYMKLLNLYPEQTQQQISDVFNKYATSTQLELQQRACEYLALPSLASEIMESVLNPMPTYELESRENILLSMEQEKANAQTPGSDRSAWAVDAGEKNASRAAYFQESERPTQSTTISSSVANEISTTVDLLSLDDEPAAGGTVTNLSGDAAVGLTAQVTAQLPQWRNAAALARGAHMKVPLLINDIVRVTIVSDYRAHQGRLSVFFDNASAFDLSVFKATVSLSSTAEAGSINCKQQDAPVLITAGDEGRMMVAVECMRPFSEPYPMNLDIRFQLQGSAYHYCLPLPVSAPCFYEPLPTDKATYMARWKSIEGENTEAQQVFDSACAVDAGYIQQHIKSTLATAMKLGPAEGLDNERTLTGSASFLTGTMSGDGKAVAVGVMMRLEVDPAQGKYRITVRSKHSAVAQSLKNFIVAQLGK